MVQKEMQINETESWSKSKNINYKSDASVFEGWKSTNRSTTQNMIGIWYVFKKYPHQMNNFLINYAGLLQIFRKVVIKTEN